MLTHFVGLIRNTLGQILNVQYTEETIVPILHVDVHVYKTAKRSKELEVTVTYYRVPELTCGC